MCVVLRKAYGGAYIVMDSRGLGTDWCVAWPTAEIAVMGAQPAVGVLYRRKLNEIEDPAARVEEERALAMEYEERFLNPYVAAERGYVDDVIAATIPGARSPARSSACRPKREHQPRRRHSNSPL